MAFPQTAAPTLYTGETATHLVPMPATVNAGDLLVTMFGYGNNSTLTAPTGWTALHLTTNPGLFWGTTRYRIADGTEDSTAVTYALNASAKAAAHTYRFTGWAGTAPEVGVAVIGNSTNGDPPNLTPSWGAADTLWLAIVFVNGGVSLSYPANYTDNTGNGLGGANGIVTGTTRRELNAASENPAAYVFTSNAWIAQTLAIPPIGAVTGTAAPTQAAQVFGGSGTVTNPVVPPGPGDNQMGGTGAIRKPPR